MRHLIDDWHDVNIIHSTSDNHKTTLASHARLPMLSSSLSTAGRDVHWQKPAPGRLKFNIDASFLQSIIHICIGICKRDDGGAFFLAKTMNFSPLCYVPIGEDLCLFNAIKWLSDMHMHSVDFVVDSKTNNVTFHSKLPDVSKFGHIISGCQRLFHSHFANFLVGGVQKATNKYYSPCFS